jgi:hypothetical protein
MPNYRSRLPSDILAACPAPKEPTWGDVRKSALEMGRTAGETGVAAGAVGGAVVGGGLPGAAVGAVGLGLLFATVGAAAGAAVPTNEYNNQIELQRQCVTDRLAGKGQGLPKKPASPALG